MTIHGSLAHTSARNYYDDFFLKRMLGYRIHGNPRIKAAVRFFSQYIAKSSVVVDIGCGIGIVAEQLGKIASKGRVLGFDISEQNIWYATNTVKGSNVSFYQLDVTYSIDDVKSLLNGAKADVLVLSDVIEHIDEAARSQLFRALSELSTMEIKILLTFPTEYYQRHLMVNSPSDLQITDNVITLATLEDEAGDAGFDITYFRLIDVWQHAQYAHCVLERKSALESRVDRAVCSTTLDILMRPARWLINRIFLGPMRRRKYITNVFGSNSGKKPSA